MNGVNLMDIDKRKKVLFLIGMEHPLEDFKKNETLNQENIIILQSYQPVISQPFDDLMRDILIAVYQENVEEIFVVASKSSEQKTVNLYNKIIENKGFQALKTLDYLFKNSMPEFSERNIKEWFEGGRMGKDSMKKTVNIIQNHPLMPSYVKVKEIWMDEKIDIQSEIKAI